MPFVLLAAAALTACPVEHAGYRLRGSPGITATCQSLGDRAPDVYAGIALRLHLAASGRTYWFLPDLGGTNGLQYLLSTTDVDAPGWRPPSPDGGPRPLGRLEWVGTDARYTIIDEVPRRGRPAPAHMLVTGLGDALWHADPRRRDGVPKQFFDLVACRPHGH